MRYRCVRQESWSWRRNFIPSWSSSTALRRPWSNGPGTSTAKTKTHTDWLITRGCKKKKRHIWSKRWDLHSKTHGSYWKHSPAERTSPHSQGHIWKKMDAVRKKKLQETSSVAGHSCMFVAAWALLLSQLTLKTIESSSAVPLWEAALCLSCRGDGQI